MKPEPVPFAADRTILVPPGTTIRTGYVAIEDVRLACRDRMSVGDVSAAYQRLLQNAPSQPFPCPNGYWDGGRFVIQDGRHAYVAALMLGWSHLLVTWLELGDVDQLETPNTGKEDEHESD